MNSPYIDKDDRKMNGKRKCLKLLKIFFLSKNASFRRLIAQTIFLMILTSSLVASILTESFHENRF